MTKKYKIATIAAVAVLLVIGVFTWSNQKNNILCTMEARSGLTVQLQDQDGNAMTDAKIISGQEVFFDGKNGSYSGLYEGNGKYEFKIEKDGFQTYTGNVDLKRDQCHVIRQTQNIILQKINK